MPIIYDPPGFGGDETLAELVDEVLSNLQGNTYATDRVTSLTSDITDSTLTFKVDNPDMVSNGIIEVDTELMWVQSVDPTAGEVRVLPQGRGWRSTGASNHAAGSTVTVQPAFPRVIVSREINNQVAGLHPALFGVATDQFTLDSFVKWGWGIPADCESVLDVRWRNSDGNWERVTTWEVENSSAAADFPTGKCLNIAGVQVGSQVQVVYSVRPGLFATPQTTFTATGLPVEAKDLLVWGALARLLPAVDVARLTVNTAESVETGGDRPQGLATQISGDFRKRYDARLKEIQVKLRQKYPSRIHTTR